MNDYTPTTDEVRDSLVHLNKYYAEQYGDVDLLVVESETAAQFDRWLAEVERAAAEKALEEAADAWHAEHSGTRPVPYNWLRARAAEIREGKNDGES